MLRALPSYYLWHHLTTGLLYLELKDRSRFNCFSTTATDAEHKQEREIGQLKMIQLPTPLTSWQSFSWCLLHETVRMYARSLYHPTEFIPNYHMPRNQLQHRVEDGCQRLGGCLLCSLLLVMQSTFRSFFLTQISKHLGGLFLFFVFPFFFFRFNDSRCPGELITHQLLAKSPTTAHSSTPRAWSLHCTCSKNKVRHLQPNAECKTRQNAGPESAKTQVGTMTWNDPCYSPLTSVKRPRYGPPTPMDLPVLQLTDPCQSTKDATAHSLHWADLGNSSLQLNDPCQSTKDATAHSLHWADLGNSSVTANSSVSINQGCYNPLTSLSWPGQQQFTAGTCLQCWCTPVSWPVRNQFLSQNSPRWHLGLLMNWPVCNTSSHLYTDVLQCVDSHNVLMSTNQPAWQLLPSMNTHQS